MLVAGRNPGKARAFCAGIPNMVPVEADRDAGLEAVLAAQRPGVVIDAAGPFQQSDDRVARACIAAGVHYVDLADARGFVTGIGVLDAEARAAGVAVIAGASSVPALSGAVARRLAEGLDEIRTVEIAISASNRATAGPSVTAAILGYVGQPVRLWRGQRWTQGRGWQEIRRERFAVSDAAPLAGRLVALADVPDHDLLPAMLPGRPATTFRAGTEFAHQTIGLWLLSWPARWLRCRATRLAPLLRPLQRLAAPFTSDRSAMSVRLKGRRGDGFVERRWTLIAEAGDGPEIPALAAVLLAEAAADGTLTAGARDAGGLLTLDAFEPLFATLSLRHELGEAPLPPPLYRRVMGIRFDALPPAVRAIHEICGDGGARGEAVVTGGSNPLARLVARIMRFPRPGTWPLHVAFTETDGVERWTRHFGERGFHSHLGESDGMLTERFGPMRFRFELPSDEGGLEMRMAGWRILGVPLPLALASRSPAREWQEGDRFRFDVPIALPLIGTIVHYSGWLRPGAPPAG